MPPQLASLPEGVVELPPGTLPGLNDWQRIGYGGPCPPIGTHRYFHKIFALDVVLPDLQRPSKVRLESAMQGHVLASCELVGRYRRQRRERLTRP